VALVATGLDVELLARIDFANTAPVEDRLLDWAGAHKAAVPQAAPVPDAASLVPRHAVQDRRLPGPAAFSGAPMLIDVAYSDAAGPTPDAAGTRVAAAAMADLPVEGALPGFAGAVEWLNSAPLTPQALRGKVVLVNFWTFGCINCQHALPHVRAWAEKYRDHGLVVVGVHTPELPFEKDIGNVRKAVARLRVAYPVAVDTSYSIWKAFGNEYWPALYFVDAAGRIRHHHFGEHDYETSERVIQQLLEEAGNRNVPGGLVTASDGR
jgi:thiol-disulfide isomerase/thioredoxin